MPVPHPPPPPPTADAVVARLRGAGCVFAEDEAALIVAQARTPAELADLVDRRAAGQPLEHVLGWARFRGQRIAVDPGVFVPRRRTGFLAGQAVALARRAPDRPPAVVVELCCGSGALGAVLLAELDRVELHAVDLDPAAVRCARRNLGAGGRVYAGDLYGPLPAALRGTVDVVVANAPYVPTDAVGLMPPEARLHEPLLALDGGADGLDVLRRVVAGAPGWLAPGGHLLFEAGSGQVRSALAAVAAAGLRPQVLTCDEVGATVVLGRLGGGGPVR